MRYHLTPSLLSLRITNAGGGVEKREPSYTVGGNVNWYNHYGKQYGLFLRKLNLELPHNQAIPLLGRYTDGQQAHEKRLNITDYERNGNQNYFVIPPHTSQNGLY